MKNIMCYTAVLSILMSACNYKVATATNAEECIPITFFKLNKPQRAIIKSALLSRVVNKEKNLNLNRFCAYKQSTSNGRFYLLTIFQSGTNHVSQNWILLSNSQAIDTRLNRYFMVTDSMSAKHAILESLNKLKADSTAQKELYLMLMHDMHYYIKQGVKLGSQK